QGVGNQGAGGLVVLNFLDVVGVGADDGVHPVGLKQLFDGLLGVADGVVVLAAPVEHGNGDVRLLLLHRRHNGGDFVPVDALVGAVVVLIEHIHAVFAAGG